MRLFTSGGFGLFLCILFSGNVLAEEPLTVAEPAEVRVSEPRQPERERWSWNRQHAKVTEQGKIEWTPEQFRFEAGESKRYIDYEGGNDNNDGTSTASAWKHHPWDAAATGNAKACTGIHTYIFKRGVLYRGTLTRSEKGQPGNPVRLTSDPAWGKGEAVLAGSRRITGWKKGADNSDIPDGDKVWYTDIDCAPRLVWQVDEETVIPLVIARTPNWRVSDPEDVMSEWWEWQQPQWWTNKWKTTVNGKKMHLGVDRKHLNKNADYYVGGTVWSEWGICMGNPYPARIQAYDKKNKGIAFEGYWSGDTQKIITGNRYFLEGKPQYLDSPGEFWFRRSGKSKKGRLFLRLPEDADPNRAVIEAADRISMIDVKRLEHVHISGLSFRFGNVFYDYHLRFFMNPDIVNAAIRVKGSAKDVVIRNNRFDHLIKAVFMITAGPKTSVTDIVVSDNEIRFTEHGAIQIWDDGSGYSPNAPFGLIDRIHILRNRFFHIGPRGIPGANPFPMAINIHFAKTLEVAGNVLQRCYGAGIFVHGGKPSGHSADVPLVRTLIYNNSAVDTLLATNDWGGIETWQCGPFYIFNNISGNANGYWHWKARNNSGNPRLGFSFYFDGSFKNHVFNNVAWGRSSDTTTKLANETGFYVAGAQILNEFYNNTASKFRHGSQWSAAAGRGVYYGNLFDDISVNVMAHSKVKEQKKEVKNEYPIHTIAMGGSVIHNAEKDLAVFEKSGKRYNTLEKINEVLKGYKSILTDFGIITENQPMRDPDRHDFRLTSDSAARDRGAKFFVPWSIGATVGEWHFRRTNTDPPRVQDHHWYATYYMTDRGSYSRMRNHYLSLEGMDSSSFVKGPLEDWIPGSLRFNGTDQYAAALHSEMTRPYTYSRKTAKRKTEKATAAEKQLATPDIDTQNLLIEIYFRTEKDHAGSVLISKKKGTGYQLALGKKGGITLTLQAGETTAELACGIRVNDGKWHHVIAECDRKSQTGRIYVDGKPGIEGRLALPAEAGLSNSGDLYVGRGEKGHYFAGDVEYLRIARSTLKDSQTTIEELYDWQFDGPCLRDFRGMEVRDGKRDAGAFEYAE